MTTLGRGTYLRRCAALHLAVCAVICGIGAGPVLAATPPTHLTPHSNAVHKLHAVPQRAGARRLPAPKRLVPATSAVAPKAAAPGTVPTLAAPRLNEDVFSVGFARIADTYLVATEPQETTLIGLNGLSSLDPTVSARIDGQSVRLYVSDQPAGEYIPSASSDPGQWGGLVTKAIEHLRPLSAKIAAAAPERIYQVVFDAIAAKLDGYSRYSSARRAAEERAVREGYGEAGIIVDAVRDSATIRSIRPGSSAMRAGLRIGDQIVAIDSRPTAWLRPDDLRNRLRGPAGTEVRVAVRRGAHRFDLTLRREWTTPRTVHAAVSDGIAVIQVDRFSAATATHLRDAVVRARKTPGQPLKGLVLDLRGNPGGLLDQAISVADLFISHGRIVSTEGRHPDSWQVWEARPDDIAAGLPLVVLQDGRSASSAEVVAAALQDSGRAVVVGSASYGKGSVQTVTRLPNNGELFLTWSRFFTPAGHSLNHQGVQPSVCTSDGIDTDAMLDDLRQQPTPPKAKFVSLRSAVPDKIDLDHQHRACLWREHSPETDLAVARTLIADQALYNRAVMLASNAAVAQR